MHNMNNEFFSHIEASITNCDKSSVIIFEIGHIKLPLQSDNLDWAKMNILHAEKMMKYLIKKYNKKVRIIPAIIINNFAEKINKHAELDIIEYLVNGCIFINQQSLHVFHERNLRNRAVVKLQRKDLLRISYDRVFVKGKEPICRIPIGNLSTSERIKIIPRCGLIAYCFIDDVVKLATNRLFQQKAPLINILSFSQHIHEMESMKIGADIHWLSSLKSENIQYTMLHWSIYGSYTSNYKRGKIHKWSKSEYCNTMYQSDLFASQQQSSQQCCSALCI